MKHLLQKLKTFGARARRRRGGLNFFELVIAMLIISITSVAVASSFYTAYGELNRQRRAMYANKLLEAEAEYWKGRIHSQFPTAFEMAHTVPNPKNPIPLDKYTPAGGRVLADINRAPIVPVDKFETKIHPDWYEIRVYIRYLEPTFDVVNGPRRYKEVVKELVVPFIPSSL